MDSPVMYLTIAATFRAKKLIFIVFPGPLSNGCFMKMYSLVCVVGGRGEGGRWVVKNVLYGEAPARGPTPYPFMNHF